MVARIGHGLEPFEAWWKKVCLQMAGFWSGRGKKRFMMSEKQSRSLLKLQTGPVLLAAQPLSGFRAQSVKNPG